MNKCICDFCDNKKADRRYEVRQTYFKYRFVKNEPVDICDDCFKLLFIEGKKFLNR